MPRSRSRHKSPSPLFVRFAATRVSGHSGSKAVAAISGDSHEWYLHPTKGWRKRSLGAVPETEVLHEDDSMHGQGAADHAAAHEDHSS